MFRYLGLVAVVSTLCTAPALAQEVCGNWEVVGVTAEPQGTTDTWLRAVKAFAEDDVWAVGHYRVEFPGTHEDYTLIQHWDGNEWRVVPSPSPGLDYDGGTRCDLYAIDGTAPDDIWAVGVWKTQNVAGHVGSQPLMLHWDGSTWEWVEAPFSVAHSSGSFPFAVVALAPDNVWAGGIWPAPTGYGFDALMLHWDGSSWEVVPTPRVDYQQEISGMAARGPNDIWAVGGYGTNRHTSYVIHYDGTSWEYVDVPDASPYDWLTDVTLLDNGEIWASTDDIIAGPSYYLHFDGSSWENVEAPVQAWSIEAIAPNDIWAGGWDNYAHWDGTSWTAVEEVAGRRVHDIDILDACDLWSVSLASTGELPPVERLTPAEPPLTLDIELDRVTASVPPGGFLEYDVTVHNPFPTVTGVAVWIDVIKPNGSPWVGNPILGPRSATLLPGQQVTKRIAMRIPVGTPPSGPYTMRGSIGLVPDVAEDTSEFTFQVE